MDWFLYDNILLHERVKHSRLIEKETYAAENNLHLFSKSQIQLKLNNSGVHSSFTRSELHLSTEC